MAKGEAISTLAAAFYKLPAPELQASVSEKGYNFNPFQHTDASAADNF